MGKIQSRGTCQVHNQDRHHIEPRYVRHLWSSCIPNPSLCISRKMSASWGVAALGSVPNRQGTPIDKPFACHMNHTHARTKPISTHHARKSELYRERSRVGHCSTNLKVNTMGKLPHIHSYLTTRETCKRIVRKKDTRRRCTTHPWLIQH